MSEKKFHIRPYRCSISPNARKADMLKATISYLDSLTSVFRSGFTALLAGIDPSTVSRLAPSGAVGSPDLWSAVNWFRIVPLAEAGDARVGQASLKNLFRGYAGHEPDEEASIYMESRVDDKRHAWVDCRAMFRAMALECGLEEAQLASDVFALASREVIVFKDGEINGWGIASLLFGEGEKADSQKKVALLRSVRLALEGDYATYEELSGLMLAKTGASSGSDLLDEYKRSEKGGSSGGRHPFFDEVFRRGGRVKQDERERLLKSCDTAIQKQGQALPLSHVAFWRQWFLRRVTLLRNRRQESFAVCITNALMDLQPKNLRNVHYVTNPKSEKDKGVLELRVDVKNNEGPDVAGAQAVFDAYMARLAPDLRFSVMPRHLGSLKDLYALWAKLGRDEAIEEYLEGYEGPFSKRPIAGILQIIHAHRGKVGHESLLRAARLNRAMDRLERKRAHACAAGNKGYVYGNSSMVGRINPQGLEVGGRKSGRSPMMWVTLDLVDGDRFAQHHLPFHSARFFSEVYCHGDGLPATRVPGMVRNRRNGLAIGNGLGGEGLSALRAGGDRRKRANKRTLRALENITHNVEIDPSTSFTLREDGIIISHRIEKIEPKLVAFGDRALGFDLNQTGAHTFAVLQKVDSGGLDVGHSRVSIVLTGTVRSICKGNQASGGRDYDMLSYDGPERDDGAFTAWRSDRQAFLMSAIRELPTPAEGEKDYKADLLSQMASLDHYRRLYAYNRKCLGIYIGALRRATRRQAVAAFKDEILSIANHRCGPLMRGSLSVNGMESLANLKGLATAYLSKFKDSKSEDLLSKDEEMADLYRACARRMTGKRKERYRRAASEIVRLANEHGCLFVFGEKELPTTSKGNKSKQNQRSTDWSARAIVKAVKEACEGCGLGFKPVWKEYSSLTDPFERDGDGRPALRCRFAKVAAPDSELPPRLTKAVGSYVKNALKADKAEKKQTCYQRGAIEFCSRHGIDVRKATDKAIRKAVRGSSDLLVPFDGGRTFLLSTRLSPESRKVEWAGRTLYEFPSDMVAAINIACRGLEPRKA